MCFATGRFSQGDAIMKSLCETPHCFWAILWAITSIICFPAGKRALGRMLVAFHWGRGCLQLEMLNKSDQPLGEPSSPFERLSPPKPPSSLWQGPCLCLLCSLPDGLLLLLRGHHHHPPPTPHSSNPHSFCQLFLQSNLPCRFCSSLDCVHLLNLISCCFSLFKRVLRRRLINNYVILCSLWNLIVIVNRNWKIATGHSSR